MGDPDALTAFLRARLAEDEAVARATTGGEWEVGPTFGARDNRVYVRPAGDLLESIGTCVIAGQVPNVPEWRANAQHIARWDPARVLAEVAAKRAILHDHRPIIPSSPGDIACASCGDQGCCGHDAPWPCDTILALAQPYDAHPDFDPAWKLEDNHG